MINIKKLDNMEVSYYEIDNVTDFNEFIQWLYSLEENDMSMAFDGRLYRFRTAEERIQFVFGFQAAWDLQDTLLAGSKSEDK